MTYVVFDGAAVCIVRQHSHLHSFCCQASFSQLHACTLTVITFHVFESNVIFDDKTQLVENDYRCLLSSFRCPILSDLAIQDPTVGK